MLWNFKCTVFAYQHRKIHLLLALRLQLSPQLSRCSSICIRKLESCRTLVPNRIIRRHLCLYLGYCPQEAYFLVVIGYVWNQLFYKYFYINYSRIFVFVDLQCWFLVKNIYVRFNVQFKIRVKLLTDNTANNDVFVDVQVNYRQIRGLLFFLSYLDPLLADGSMIEQEST